MSSAVAFDTLSYVKKLRDAGVPERQAEAQAEAMVELVEERLATKQDIRDLQRDIKELEYRMTIKLGGLMVLAVGSVATLVKLL